MYNCIGHPLGNDALLEDLERCFYRLLDLKKVGQQQKQWAENDRMGVGVVFPDAHTQH